MKKSFILLLLALPLCVFGQSNTPKQTKQSPTVVSSLDFDSYCRLNALAYLSIPKEKLETVNFVGELKSLEYNSEASYKDYEIELKENETQYFKLIGSEKILAVKSLYSLRLSFQNQQK